MPLAPCNDIEICYEQIGSDDDPALLLIRGHSGQMIAWRDDFCRQLAERGFRVIRFDNRDVGLSTKLDAPYALEDMARDVTGLMDHLAIRASHLVGMSMGGMIAQRVTIDRPGRVLSLASIMSHIGGTDSVGPTEAAIRTFVAPPPATREEAIERSVADHKVIGSPGFPFDEQDARDIAARSYDRCNDNDGPTRQAMAIMSAPSRKDELASVHVPTVVIHGDADPLIPVENASRTAQAIPDSRLEIIEGMGHDLPRPAWPRIIEAIVSNAQRVSTPR